MTGFGVATIDKPSENINLEIKSLNSRNLDIRFSGLNISAEFEQKIKKIRDIYIGYCFVIPFLLQNALISKSSVITGIFS